MRRDYFFLVILSLIFFLYEPIDISVFLSVRLSVWLFILIDWCPNKEILKLKGTFYRNILLAIRLQVDSFALQYIFFSFLLMNDLNHIRNLLMVIPILLVSGFRIYFIFNKKFKFKPFPSVCECESVCVMKRLLFNFSKIHNEITYSNTFLISSFVIYGIFFNSWIYYLFSNIFLHIHSCRIH